MKAKPLYPILQKDHSLAQGLLLAWLFNEGGGIRIKDHSGHGWHGVAQNFTLSGSWKIGRYGKMLGLDGTNDRVVNTILTALGTKPRTLLMWVNSRTQSGVNVMGEISNATDGGVKPFGYYFNGTTLHFWNSDAGGDNTLSAGGWTTGYHALISTKPITAAGGKTSWNTLPAIDHVNDYVGSTGAGMVIGVPQNVLGQNWHPEIDIIAAMVWNRVLTTAEKALLLGDPLTHFRD